MFTVYAIYSYALSTIIYVGCSGKIQDRIQSHLKTSQKGKHLNNLIQKHVDFFGVGDLIFQYLMQHKDETYAYETEKYFIAKHNAPFNKTNYDLSFEYTGNYEIDRANISVGRSKIFNMQMARHSAKRKEKLKILINGKED